MRQCEHQTDKAQLTDLDTDVEAKQRNRNIRLRQAGTAECAGKAETVQQAKGERPPRDGEG